MREKLNLAVIGTGRWGKNIIKTLELFSWCSVAYTANHNYHTLLKKEDIDAVLIATPAETHMRVALPFIQKRVPVFIEKPFTTNLKDAKRLARASQKAKNPHICRTYSSLQSRVPCGKKMLETDRQNPVCYM